MDLPWVVQTFGYGDTHDPHVLAAVADAAKGVYSYVHERALVANAVADCFGGLASSVAIRLELAIRPALGVAVQAVRTAYKV